MTPIEVQIGTLAGLYPGAQAKPIGNGGHLIEVPNFRMPKGWNRDVVTLLFVAPPGFPAAQPDCFWVEPVGVRLQNGATPQNTNDSNQIPGVPGPPRGTWFSWHLQSWNPNRDSLLTFVNVIKQRLDPPR